MRIKSFEFNLRELAGSMGDFGTLFPFAIGYIVVNGLNPAGFLVMMGLANIATGLVYRLPIGATVLVSLTINMALGFAAGLAVHYLTRWVIRQRGGCACDGSGDPSQ